MRFVVPTPMTSRTFITGLIVVWGRSRWLYGWLQTTGIFSSQCSLPRIQNTFSRIWKTASLISAVLDRRTASHLMSKSNGSSDWARNRWKIRRAIHRQRSKPSSECYEIDPGRSKEANRTFVFELIDMTRFPCFRQVENQSSSFIVFAWASAHRSARAGPRSKTNQSAYWNGSGLLNHFSAWFNWLPDRICQCNVRTAESIQQKNRIHIYYSLPDLQNVAQFHIILSHNDDENQYRDPLIVPVNSSRNEPLFLNDVGRVSRDREKLTISR
jgi:hypothetical protein